LILIVRTEIIIELRGILCSKKAANENIYQKKGEK